MKRIKYTHHVLLLLLMLCMSVGNAWGQLTITDLTGSLYTGGSTTVNLNTSTQLVYGDVNVHYSNFADLVDYKVLELVVTDGTPRLLFNRVSGDGNGGTFLEINSPNDPYVTKQGNIWRIDLEKIRLNDANHYVHLNAIKGANYANVTVTSMKLYSYPSISLADDGIYKRWNGVGKWVGEDTSNPPSCEKHFGESRTDGEVIYGNVDVDRFQYADLSNYSKLVLAYTGAVPRVLFNRQTGDSSNNGMIEVSGAGTYATIEDGLMVIDLTKLGIGTDNFAHLNGIKAQWGQTTTVYSARMYTETEWYSINFPTLTKATSYTTQEEELDIPSNNQFTISAAYFKTLLGSYPGYLRFTAYNSSDEPLEIPEVTSEYRNWYSFGEDGYASHDNQTLFWNDNGSVVVTLPEGTARLECYALTSVYNWSGNCVESNGGTLITYTVPAPDTFESSLKTGGSKGYYLKDYIETETSSTAVDFSKALEKLGSTPKYVRFILTKNGEAVDPTGKLVITGATPAPQQTSKPKQGYYLYNSGNNLNVSGVTVTLNGADYADYRVVCVLSTDAAAAATGNVVETEPQWDVQYTYSFTKITMLPFSQLTNPYLQLNIHDQVLNYFGKTEEEMKDSWHADWCVRDKSSRAVQPLRKGNTQGNDVWSAYVGYWDWQYQNGNDYGATLNQNYIYAGKGTAADKGKDLLEAVQRMLGFLQLYAPNAFSTMQAASDYEIVYQVDDEYVNAWMPDMKGRWIFRITPFENEPNTGMTTADKPQEPNHTDVSFTLVDMPTDAKYARFYLLDKDNNAIAPGTILSVSGGTACAKTTSGIYLYNNGSVVSPTVTIAAPNAYKLYKVVGLFSTSLDGIVLDGTTVNQEPKWDMQWTYNFDYNITTYEQTPQIEWNAVAMTADATPTDIDTDWKTSLEELAVGQCIKWYVTDGSSNVQPLAIGTERQSGTWTIALPTGFVVDGNVALLNGKKTIEPEQFASWVATNVYAPSEATYAEVSNHKIVFEIYTNDAGTAPPNARYTFSIHKGFVGTLKSGKTATTVRLNPTSGATTFTFNATIPSGTRHSRFYLTNLNDTPIDYTIADMNAQYSTPVSNTVEGYNISLGTYRYATDPIGPATEQITLTLSTATLDQYKVVVVTSGDAAVFSGDVMTSEPDWDTQTTYWFKYPAAGWSPEANVEWSAQSMQITAPDIETNKGADYLDNNKSHYTMQWYVVDNNGDVQGLTKGSGRLLDRWAINVNGDPYSIIDNIAAVTNDDNLSNTTFANWAAPVFYAPSNLTMREVAERGIHFVCKFYEDDQTPLSEALCTMTYTVYIDKQDPHAQLKDGGKRGGETISEGLTSETTDLTLDLTRATAAFSTAIGKTATYARIYLTKSDGTVVDPTTALTGTGGTAFSDPTYGYYLYNTNGISLPYDASLKLEAGKYSFYNVVVAMSADTDEQGHTHDLAPRRAANVRETYEPDYDYIYTIKFAGTSNFPGRVTDDAFLHSKEILVANDEVASVTIPLAENINKIKSEYGVSSLADLKDNLHIRWYLAKKAEDGTFDKIPGSENYLTAVSGTYWNHRTEDDYGLYWNSATSSKPSGDTDAANVMNVTVTKAPGGSVPALTGSWEDYKLIIVMSNDLTGQTTEERFNEYSTSMGFWLTHEPDNLNMVYTYSFFKEAAFLFVHDKGASERPYYTQGDFTDAVQQYSWNNENSTRETVSDKIRQGVHTVEYDIYVDPTSSTPINLKLPFENYYGDGDVLEPTAYIRWYDWMTDINNTRLAIAGGSSSMLEDKEETNQGATVSRGLFMLNNSVGGILPTHTKVGATFNPAGLNEMVTIACDVSKYYDGIYSGSADDDRPGFSGKKKPYLMHEPTLSTRYIFHIRPASVIATDIQIGHDKLNAGGADMFQLAEDNGRVSVAMKNASTEFSIRANLSELDYYYIYNGTSPTVCSEIAWYAYFEDETGIYRNDTKLTLYDSDKTNRISRIQVSALNGTYNAISGSGSKTVEARAGQRFHLVGYIGDGTSMAPVVHYEVNLIDAPAYDVAHLPLERTEAYLRQHMTLQATVDFDGLCGTELSETLTSQRQNHSTEPMPWLNAEYGFCYPDVRRIWANSNTDYMGISPLHGDYMLLRSMNMTGVSKSETYDYYYHWWDSSLLYDYTYSFGLENSGKYGSFLYVDASDESRTIAKMDFQAQLCAGSELCFTGVVANMTGGNVQPQVMATVYAVKGNGVRTRVVSFHSSNLSTNTAGTYNNGVWYQMYGRVAIPSSVDLTGVDHYEVNIDNYSPGTNGADYAVDQLQFYTSNAKLKVKQEDVECGDLAVKMNVYIDDDALVSKKGYNIYWRICDSNGTPLTDPMLYDGTNLYGTTSVPTNYPATIPTEAEFKSSTATSGYFMGTDGHLYFSLAKKPFQLVQGEQYYVSVYLLSETGAPTDEDLWGKNTDACDVYSPIFVPKMMYLEMQDPYTGNVVTVVNGNCSTGEATVALNVVLQMPDDDEILGFRPYDDIHFDFFKGTLAEFNAYKITVGSDDYYLSDALKHYRNKENVSGSDAYKTATNLVPSYESVNPQYYAVINKAISEGLLFLSCSNSYNGTVDEVHHAIAALPIEDKVNNGTTDFNICTPLEYVFTVNMSGNAPTIVLGFEDVTYPDGVRVVRVGKEQLLNMQNGDYLLHIPVNTFKVNDGAIAKTGTLNIVGDLDLLKYATTDIYQTTDSKVLANVDKVATFASTTISGSQMYIAVNFHGTGVTKPTFYEGYAYRMFFQVKDADDADACEGNVEFLLKVVPEFVTWNGTGTNWNNDANWGRSTRAELNKSADATQNTATIAQEGIYQDNLELRGNATIPKTYAPMKFTYVTIPTGLQAPNLVNLTYDTKGIYNNIGTGATENIQYDIMVRYTEKTCQGGTNHNPVLGSVYDCEKFYGNWAKELYMKPRAELLNQQYLTYEKVWVEKELASNSWTLMSTPLQNTYAGDMYVPVTADAETNGRQLTEAFQPISFSTTENAAGVKYSRTQYPIYQRGWTQAGVYVYTKTNDVRATKYSANIPGGVSDNLVQWSHAYNDVTVPYSTWTAFSIKPHKKDQTAATLIRLPKADTSFDYYQWDNQQPTSGQLSQNVEKSTTGKLLTDGTANISGVTYGTLYGTTVRTAGSGTFNAAIADIQSSPANYQLVGNPYLCSIDMATFLAGNTANLDVSAYWTYTNNDTSHGLTNGTIGPMQSFFVKAKANATQITFTPAMMVDRAVQNTSLSAPTVSLPDALLLTARNDHGSSLACIQQGEVQAVETLFDSNLSDVPMVYTVADGMAVSINQMPELQLVSFGVTCNSDEAVDVTLTGVDAIGGDLEVVDAVDGTTQVVTEGMAVSVLPNEYGRYFLMNRAATGIDQQVKNGIVVSSHDGLVTVSAAQPLGTVRALSLNGATLFSASDCQQRVQFPLQQGVYIINTDGAAGRSSTKIVVRKD